MTDATEWQEHDPPAEREDWRVEGMRELIERLGLMKRGEVELCTNHE